MVCDASSGLQLLEGEGVKHVDSSRAARRRVDASRSEATTVWRGPLAAHVRGAGSGSWARTVCVDEPPLTSLPFGTSVRNGRARPSKVGTLGHLESETRDSPVVTRRLASKVNSLMYESDDTSHEPRTSERRRAVVCGLVGWIVLTVLLGSGVGCFSKRRHCKQDGDCFQSERCDIQRGVCIPSSTGGESTDARPPRDASGDMGDSDGGGDVHEADVSGESGASDGGGRGRDEGTRRDSVGDARDALEAQRDGHSRDTGREARDVDTWQSRADGDALERDVRPDARDVQSDVDDVRSEVSG